MKSCIFIDRFHGSYNAMCGGRLENAFLTVTGGYAEYIGFDHELEADAEGSKMEKARAVHRRIANACQCGALLVTAIPVSLRFRRSLCGMVILCSCLRSPLNSLVCLTHSCLASHKRDIGKQCKPRSDAADQGLDC